MTGRLGSVTVNRDGLRKTVDPILTLSHHQQGHCQTVLPLHSLTHFRCLAGTRSRGQPRARLTGSAYHHIVRVWGYRGVRVGEASHPGPEGGEPPRVATLHRAPVGEKASCPCSIRLTPQDSAWIWIVHSSPPLKVGRKTPAEALQKWLQKFEHYIVPASQALLRDLHRQWCDHPIPPPPVGAKAGPRAKSTPPRVGSGNGAPLVMTSKETARLMLRLLVRLSHLHVGFARKVPLPGPLKHWNQLLRALPGRMSPRCLPLIMFERGLVGISCRIWPENP